VVTVLTPATTGWKDSPIHQLGELYPDSLNQAIGGGWYQKLNLSHSAQPLGWGRSSEAALMTLFDRPQNICSERLLPLIYRPAKLHYT